MFEQIHQIWKSFYQFEVKYITIGGFAVNIYGYTRNTGDLDILVEDTLVNRKKLREALKHAQIGDFPQLETIQFVTGWTDFTLDYGLRLDIMTSVKGLENVDFKDLFNQATEVKIEDFIVYFVDYKNLIQTKKATNRLKDQLDIEELKKVNPNS